MIRALLWVSASALDLIKLVASPVNLVASSLKLIGRKLAASSVKFEVYGHGHTPNGPGWMGLDNDKRGPFSPVVPKVVETMVTAGCAL